MSESQQPENLKTTFVIVDERQRAEKMGVTGTFWLDLDAKFGDFAGMSLIAAFSFDDDWPTWEVHPHGDEVVCLMSGDVTMVLDEPGGERTIRLSESGEFVVVPKNTWHTARVHAPTTMIFVTPGQDTQNRETPESNNG